MRKLKLKAHTIRRLIEREERLVRGGLTPQTIDTGTNNICTVSHGGPGGTLCATVCIGGGACGTGAD